MSGRKTRVGSRSGDLHRVDSRSGAENQGGLYVCAGNIHVG